MRSDLDMRGGIPNSRVLFQLDEVMGHLLMSQNFLLGGLGSGATAGIYDAPTSEGNVQQASLQTDSASQIATKIAVQIVDADPAAFGMGSEVAHGKPTSTK